MDVDVWQYKNGTVSGTKNKEYKSLLICAPCFYCKTYSH